MTPGGQRAAAASWRTAYGRQGYDRGFVLETGRVVLHGDRETLLADARVQRAYLGS